MEPWQGPVCSRCGQPFPSGRALDAASGLCGECRGGEFRFDMARSYGLYRGPLRKAILQLKFRRQERLGKKLGGLLAATWGTLSEALHDSPALLVPVPLHRVRERERGFNQAELLARGLARALSHSWPGVPPKVECGVLCRIRATPPQTGLSTAARHENVRGGFSVTSPERVHDRVIVLVDDVMTTGATLSACASALKAADARSVLALALARATPEFPDFDLQDTGSAVDDFSSARS